jgi:hypothetical protein
LAHVDGHADIRGQRRSSDEYPDQHDAFHEFCPCLRSNRSPLTMGA